MCKEDVINYMCQHCGANLDEGDIFEHFMLQYEDRVKALEVAKKYGWSETNKIHFNRSVIVQPDRGEQYIICPECNTKWPFKNLHGSKSRRPAGALL
jgi:DNA-directed RNA polymerase subunit RPC12/RpoP